jgi:hypothetical protein
LLTIFTCVFLTINVLAGQSNDTTNAVTKVQTDTSAAYSVDVYDGTDDFSPGLAFFTLIGIGFILVCVGAGIVITVIVLLILFGLISGGILSVSLIVGLNKRSFASGFKTFLVTTTSFGGLLIGGLGFWLINELLHWWTTQIALSSGACMGLIAGFIFGIFAFYVLQKLTTYLQNQLKQNQ